MLRLQGAAVDAINPSVELTEAERIDRLRLIRSDNVGPRGIVEQTPQGPEGINWAAVAKLSFGALGIYGSEFRL
ncbi:hypothetical protein IVA80_17675 [Bradyrhizobium sp. 139]|uniref:hypothetical protein n=1 Tax=Bradyrhizobium sp. 139 TaxID=2782616 RepID=UPI001FF734D9|nr:hypothetical protein [Bradyrhizobium sp. 139]MCK1742647.1 hypothetical protein [Bradyrhizobium sp. 139]